MITLVLAFLAAEPASQELAAENERCLASAECASGLECRSKVCVAPGTGLSCQRSADCPSDLVCRESQCVTVSALPPSVQQRAPLKYFVAPAPAASVELPPGLRYVERKRTGVWVSGLSIFLASYTVAGVIGSLGIGSPLAFIPVLGSFFSPATVPSYMAPISAAVQIPLGIVQLAGSVMLIAGISSKKKVLVYSTGTDLVVSGRF